MKNVALPGLLRAIKLGDKFAAVATPIARALKLPCIDPKTNELKSDSGCAKREKRWNGE